MKTSTDTNSDRSGTASRSVGARLCQGFGGQAGSGSATGGSRTSRSTSILALLAFAFAFATAARAQWQSTVYSLRGGWNSIYLHGDANHATLEALFADNPEIVSVWRWTPNPNQIQFESSPLIPSNGTPEWSIWTRGGTANSLSSLPGRTAYLVECAGVATDTYSLSLTHKVQPPRSTWVRNGANLLGFPSRLATNETYPPMSAYFATFPVAIAANTKIYKYVGGPLGPANPIEVFSTASERVDRKQAYWFEAAVVGNFYAPLEISPSNLDGLIYGRNGSLVTVRVRNRTSAAVTLKVEPQASSAPPAGQELITGQVPLTYRTFNTTTNAYEFAAFNGQLSVVVGPQSSVELSFGIDRAQITGATDALYASLLRFYDDAGNLMDVYLPVSARVTSLAGLWIGDIAVSNVQSNVSGSPGTTTKRSFPLRVILHVDNNGTARLLSQIFMGKLAPAPFALGLCTREVGLKADEKATARRLISSHLPPDTVINHTSGTVALGQTVAWTVPLPYNASTNPYVHSYHPDHDNRNPRFDATLPEGVESSDITRTCNFTFTVAPPVGSSAQGWGSSVIGGTYSETVTGLHKAPLTASGTFELRRMSELGTITLN